MSTDVKKRIIQNCSELFYKYGIKSISVDDISFNVGISKKTFYEYFETKNDVVKAIAIEFINKSRLLNKDIIEEKKDVFYKLMKIYKKMLSQFNTCNPSFIYDIKKFYPEVYELFIEFRDKELDYMITTLIKQGKEEGLFRENIDEKIIYKLHLNRINSIIEGSLLPEKTIADPVFFEFILINLIGITTIQGHEILEKKLKKYKNEKNF
ncbi:MAG: TetR/AcrR family transcriptional regulator [Bacteroidales bacterium]|jgi:AcrR family transcriptional regulator|nr:TetR/AcrR family transcriptional regulator [Bacteroidales bacterium]